MPFKVDLFKHFMCFYANKGDTELNNCANLMQNDKKYKTYKKWSTKII